jgi:hypothetical protein
VVRTGKPLRIRYVPRRDATPEAERSALADIYRTVLDVLEEDPQEQPDRPSGQEATPSTRYGKAMRVTKP